jgi:hypothetical protein
MVTRLVTLTRKQPASGLAPRIAHPFDDHEQLLVFDQTSYDMDALAAAQRDRNRDTTSRPSPADDQVDHRLGATRGRALPLDADSGSADVDAIVTAFVLAATPSFG